MDIRVSPSRACLLVLIAGSVSFLRPLGAEVDPVATVAGHDIRANDLEAAVSQAVNAAGYFHRVPEDKRLALRKEKLAELIRDRLNTAAGLQRGLRLPVAEARKQAEEVEQRIGRDAYRSALAAWGWSREQHVVYFSERLLAREAYRCFVAEAAVVLPEEVRRSYEEDRGRWLLPESARVQHILLAVPAGKTADEWNAREKEAADLVASILAGGDFADLASRHSDDPYRVKGGDLGWVHKGRLSEPVESAVWRARTGDVLGPLKGDDGFHVVRVTELRQPRLLTFEEAAGPIRAEMERKRLREAEERWYRELRALYPVLIWDRDLAGAGIE